LRDFCDNYLEIIKKRIYESKREKESAQYTLYYSLLTILKLIAPITPFITEEIYQKYFKKFEKDKSIHLSEFSDIKIKEKTDMGDLFIKILSKVRQEKTKMRKPMNAEIILSLDKKNYNSLKELLEDLKDVTNAKEIKEGKFKVDFI